MTYKNTVTLCCLVILAIPATTQTMDDGKNPQITVTKHGNFTYYQTPQEEKIQKTNWQADAERGVLKALRGGFYAKIEYFKKTKNINDFEQAMQCHFKTLIRARQDIRCCTDKSTTSAVKHIQFEHVSLIGNLVKNNLISNTTISEEKNKKRIVVALFEVQKLTSAGNLPSPEGITAYGLHQFAALFSPSQ